MSILDDIPFNKNKLYKDGFECYGLTQKLYFQKSIFPNNGKTQYFIKSFIEKGRNTICQGYIYFYLNKDLKVSDFIGIYVKPEYRNLGIASLLIASWIDFCLNNGYNFLGTNKTQRKPFLIYLLKTYGFEILDESIYKKSKYTIDICKSNDDYTKYLLFKSKKEQESFMNGKIAKEDNYKVIDKLSEHMSYLDSVILSYPYLLKNDIKAEEKTMLVLKRNRIN